MTADAAPVDAAPAGYTDFDADADQAIDPPPRYRPVTVDGVGVVMARRPLPNAIKVLHIAFRAGTVAEQEAHLRRFILNHTPPGELRRLCDRMIVEPDLPPDTIARTAQAIVTADTARPTKPSSPSRC